MILLTVTQKVDKNDAILGFYVEWIRGMAKRADKVQVIALQCGEYDLPDNVEVISLNKEKGAGPLSMLLRFNKELYRLCRTEKPDVILAHMVPKYALYALPMAKLFSVPVDLWYTHKGVDKTLRMAHPFIRNAFTASEASFRLKSKKRIVTGHGINTEFFKPKKSVTPQGIITVGRITPSKDQETLIKALALIQDQFPKEVLKTKIIGEPLLESDREYQKQMETLVEKEALKDVVSFAGALPHERIAAEYQHAAIMVNASHTGSVDKVVLEAMASGALPLTCNESFIPLLGKMSETFVFQKHNTQDLSVKMSVLLKLPDEEKQVFSQKLRDIVIKHHNLDALMDKLIQKMGK